jgi:hypothetical protein
VVRCSAAALVDVVNQGRAGRRVKDVGAASRQCRWCECGSCWPPAGQPGEQSSLTGMRRPLVSVKNTVHPMRY